MIKETKIDWELADKIYAREEDKILENITKEKQNIAQECTKLHLGNSSIRARMYRANIDMLAQLADARIDADWEIVSKNRTNITDANINKILARLNDTLSQHIRRFMQSMEVSAQRNRTWGSAVAQSYQDKNNRTKGKLLAKAKRELEIRRGRLELETKENVSPPLSERIKQYFHLQDSIKNEYREITFVDIDIAGSTSLKEGESKEAVIYSFEQYNQMLDNLTQKHDGEDFNRIGDERILMFKTPTDAVEMAIELQNALAEFNRDKTQNRLDKLFKVRIGINTGNCLIDAMLESSDVAEHTIDIACHLQKYGKADAVYISENTYSKLEFKNSNQFEGPIDFEKDNIKIYIYRL